MAAVRTAIDAVILAAADGEYMRSYSVGDRSWQGASFKELLQTLRAEEDDLIKKIAEESRTGGAVQYVSMRNEPV